MVNRCFTRLSCCTSTAGRRWFTDGKTAAASAQTMHGINERGTPLGGACGSQSPLSGCARPASRPPAWSSAVPVPLLHSSWWDLGNNVLLPWICSATLTLHQVHHQHVVHQHGARLHRKRRPVVSLTIQYDMGVRLLPQADNQEAQRKSQRLSASDAAAAAARLLHAPARLSGSFDRRVRTCCIAQPEPSAFHTAMKRGNLPHGQQRLHFV